MKLAILITAYALGMAGSNLLLRLTSRSEGLSWWVWFAAANATGFVCVLVLPHALKLAPANIVYALAIGTGFCLLQISAWVLFRENLSTLQWCGVGFIALGLILLQMKA